VLKAQRALPPEATRLRTPIASIRDGQTYTAQLHASDANTAVKLLIFLWHCPSN